MEHNNYQFMIRTLGHQMRLFADRKLEDFGITAEQGHTLSFIYRMEDRPVTQNDMQRFFQRKGSTMSSIVKNLEKKNLLYRKVDPLDERRKLLHLTEEGRQLVKGFDIVFDRVENQMMDGFTPAQKAMLEELLNKMIDNLK